MNEAVASERSERIEGSRRAMNAKARQRCLRDKLIEIGSAGGTCERIEEPGLGEIGRPTNNPSCRRTKYLRRVKSRRTGPILGLIDICGVARGNSVGVPLIKI